MPDYDILNFEFDGPDFTFNGSNIRVDVETANIDGATTADSINIGYYVSEDNVFDASTDYLFATDRTASFSGMSSRFESTNLSVGDAPQGVYYLFAVADYQNLVVESDETNNVSQALEFEVTNDPSLYTDVEISNFSVDTSSYEATGEITYSFDYANVSAVDADDLGGTFTIGDGNAANGGGNRWGVGLESLAAGESGSYSQTIDLSGYDMDQVYFSARIYADREQNTSNNSTESIAFTIGDGSDDPFDEGLHMGWYYEVESVRIESSDFVIGWYDGWHYENGWNVGWNLGWYVDPSVAGGYSFGWNIGWTFGWYLESGWYYGWGEVTSYSWHYQLGDLKYADGETSTYYGWAAASVGAVGMTQELNEGLGPMLPIRGGGGDIELISSATGWHFDYGWNMGWYTDATGAWAMGWNLGWFADFGAYAVFNAEDPFNSNWNGGGWGWGWVN